MYGFYEGMLVTMDLDDPDTAEDNLDIWVLVDTLPILPLYFEINNINYLIIMFEKLT